MQIEETTLAGVLLIKPNVFEDERGFFMETFHRDKFQELGLPTNFVQDNHSRSAKKTLRGLHIQYPSWQGKLIRVIKGEVFDVAVDIRRDSPGFGQWYGTYLSAQNKRQLYVPEGYAHGFCVTSKFAEVVYKCTRIYHPNDEISIAWDDPDIAIEWPVVDPILSKRDSEAIKLKDLDLS